MQGKITRREWAAALAVSAVPAPSQTASLERQPSPDELLARAGREIQRDIDEMKKFPLPVTAEPATIFRA